MILPTPSSFLLVLHPWKATRLAMQYTLEREGYRVCAHYEHPRHAMHDLFAGSLPLPDLIVVNWRFPGLSPSIAGQDVIKFFRSPQHPERQQIAILAIIPNMPMARLIMRLRGANDCLTEPLKMQLLLQLVQRYVRFHD